MRTVFRAGVMLSVLVLLPAAWIHSGPLPAAAQRVVDRAVVAARASLGLAPMGATGPPDVTLTSEIEAVAWPRDGSDAPSELVLPQHPQTIANVSVEGGGPTRLVTPAPATPRSTAGDVPGGRVTANDRIEPLLADLRELGVVDYVLEKWGSSGKLYRFHCSMPLAESEGQTRRFESVADDPLSSVQRVVADVSSWQAGRPMR